MSSGETRSGDEQSVLALARSFEGTLEPYLTDLVHLRIADSEGRIVYINKAGAHKLGYEPEELIGQSLAKIDPTSTRPPVNIEVFSTAKHQQTPISHEGRDLCKDGSIIRSRYYARSITHDGKPYLFAVNQDISDLFDALEANNQEKQICTSVFENCTDAIIFCSASGEVQRVNPAAEQLLGRGGSKENRAVDDLIVLADSHSGAVLPGMVERSKSESNGEDVILTLPSGGQVLVRETITQTWDMLGKVSGYLLRYRQTGLEETKSAFIKREIENEKYALIGRMASGISHDFNNILAGISGMAELIEMRSKSPAMERVAADIQVLTMRAAEHVKSILATQSGDTATGDRKAFNLHEILEEVVQLLRFGQQTTCSIVCDYEEANCAIVGVQGAILNAILNVAVNGVQAIDGPGTLTIRAHRTELGQDFCDGSHFNLTPGAYICVEVSDTGGGIPKENLTEIFSPYFSTKRKTGGGHGLGLPAVMVTMRQHHGMIDVKSDVGVGTTFWLYFPCAEERSTVAARLERARASAALVAEGPAKRILVVEDEKDIREVARQYLQELGHEPVLAADGIEALTIFRRAGASFDAVILDLMLPGLTGTEVFSAIREANPSIPVIISSGWAPETMSMELQGYGALTFLRKPYRLEEIAQSLRKLDAETR